MIFVELGRVALDIGPGILGFTEMLIFHVFHEVS